MVKKSENIVLDMKVGRLAKGSQAAKDFMKELREKKGKGKVSGKGNKGSRPSAADMAGSARKLIGEFHAEDKPNAPSTPKKKEGGEDLKNKIRVRSKRCFLAKVIPIANREALQKCGAFFF